MNTTDSSPAVIYILKNTKPLDLDHMIEVEDGSLLILTVS
jgi:hypothetical protein